MRIQTLILTIGLEINKDFRNITELYKTYFTLNFDGNGGGKKVLYHNSET